MHFTSQNIYSLYTTELSPYYSVLFNVLRQVSAYVTSGNRNHTKHLKKLRHAHVYRIRKVQNLLS